jgi:hypothetical protein
MWFWVSFFGSIFTEKPYGMLASLTTTNPPTPRGQPSLGWLLMLMWHQYKASRPRPGEKVEDTTTITLQSKANKNDNHFGFISSPRLELIKDYDLEDTPYYHQ